MKSFGSEIKTVAKPERPFPGKTILWATQTGWGNLKNGDMDRFPNMAAITARNSADHPNPLATFGEAVAQAQDRVWIIDRHLLDPDRGSRQNRIDQIINWMLEESFAANDIKLLTKSHNGSNNKEVDNDLAKQFQEYAEMITKSRSKGAAQCNIQVRFALTQQDFDYVHDRFAIIDDELWHFGATVGGFHSSVNAATRGWRASAHGAVDFFEFVWKLAGEKQK